MKKTFVCTASVALVGALAVLPATPAWAAPKPHISVLATGGGGPYVTGSKFTPGGNVVVTEWAAGVKKPYWTSTTSANGSGQIAMYDICDGNTALRIQARDVTTGRKSNKTAPVAYLCIG
jgi:hypothetical protein